MYLDLAKAFNEGCDARLNGVSLQDNPYLHSIKGSVEASMRESWNMGWRDVDRNWGALNRGKESVTIPPLPPVLRPTAW